MIHLAFRVFHFPSSNSIAVGDDTPTKGLGRALMTYAPHDAYLHLSITPERPYTRLLSVRDIFDSGAQNRSDVK